MEKFSDRLRKARVNAGLTQEQLGFAVDVTKSSVSAWENGREWPSFKVLPPLKESLGCSLDLLICGYTDSVGHSEYNAGAKANPNMAKNEQESILLSLYRNMSEKQQKALLELLRR